MRARFAAVGKLWLSLGKVMVPLFVPFMVLLFVVGGTLGVVLAFVWMALYYSAAAFWEAGR